MRFDSRCTPINGDFRKAQDLKELVSFKIKGVKKKMHNDVMRFYLVGCHAFVFG